MFQFLLFPTRNFTVTQMNFKMKPSHSRWDGFQMNGVTATKVEILLRFSSLDSFYN